MTYISKPVTVIAGLYYTDGSRQTPNTLNNRQNFKLNNRQNFRFDQLDLKLCFKIARTSIVTLIARNPTPVNSRSVNFS